MDFGAEVVVQLRGPRLLRRWWLRSRGSRLGLYIDFSVGLKFSGTGCSGRLGRVVRGVVVDGRAVGLFDGAQAGGDAGFAGGDGLAVAAAVGAFGQVLGVSLDFVEVGFAFVGVPGDREQGDVRGGGIEDEGDGLALGSRRAMAMTGGPWFPARPAGAGAGRA